MWKNISVTKVKIKTLRIIFINQNSLKQFCEHGICYYNLFISVQKFVYTYLVFASVVRILLQLASVSTAFKNISVFILDFPQSDICLP